MTTPEISISIDVHFFSRFYPFSPLEISQLVNAVYGIISQNIPQNQDGHWDRKLAIFVAWDNCCILNVVSPITVSDSQSFVAKIVDCFPAEKLETVKQLIANLNPPIQEFISVSAPPPGIFVSKIVTDEINLSPERVSQSPKDFWCNFVVNQGERKAIVVSPQQREVLNKQPSLPTILTGEKGNGKTTTALFSAIIQAEKMPPGGKILYLSSSIATTNAAKKLVQYYGFTRQVSVFEYVPLCQHILSKYHLIFPKKFLAQRRVTYAKFVDSFFKDKKIFSVKPEDLWQEIRRNLKGCIKSLDKEKFFITNNEYIASKNQSIFPKDTDFSLVYNLATQYQEWLQTHNYWDDLDLTHYLLSQLPKNFQGEYDIIYVDNGENLTEVQMELLLKLLTKNNKEEENLPRFFFVFDTSNQGKNDEVNRIKRLLIDNFHKLPNWQQIRNAIETQTLNVGFLTEKNIVDFKSVIGEIRGNKIDSSSFINSRVKPLVLSEISTDFLKSQSSLNFDCAIVVFDEGEKENLISLFPQDSERIISFSEAKHLQFEQLLVWKLFDSVEQSEITGNSEKYLRLSTCANMARHRIYFYDNTSDTLWDNPKIASVVEIGYETELTPLFNKEYSPHEVEMIVDKYLEYENEKCYKIAEQICKKNGNQTLLDKVYAFWEETKGNYGKAGDLWNKLGIFEKAIESWREVDEKLWLAKWSVLDKEEWQRRGEYFELIQDLNLAKFCYEKSGDFEGKLRCLEKENQWELAGDECKQRDLEERATKYYQIAEEYYRQNGQINLAVRMWTKLNKWDKVAAIWEELQQWEKAGNCWQKHGDMAKAAICWQKAKKWTEAQKCWYELGNWQQLALSYEYQESWTFAAETWLKLGEKERAAFCYQKGNQWQAAENLWRELGYWGFVAICLQQQEKWLEAAEAWNNTNPYELQALCYERASAWDKAEKAWLQTKNWTRIIIACEKQGKWQEAAESWENLGEWQKAAAAWEKIDQIEKAAICYEAGENWEKAAQCWRKINKMDNLAVCLQKQEKWEEAAAIWEELKEWENAGKAWEKIGNLEKAAICYEEGGHWRQAEECWYRMENWDRMGVAAQRQGKWQKAACDWLRLKQWEKAALCYQQCEDWERAAKYWELAEIWDKSAQAYEKLERWDKAASNYLKAGETEKAAICFEKCQDWEKAQQCWRKLWKWDRLALVCEYQQKWQEAGKAWLSAGNVEKAAICFEKCQDWQKAEECWRHLNNWQKLAEVCEYQEKWEEAAQLWQFLSRWEKAALACLKMDDLETAIKYYEKGGYLEEAEKCRQQLLAKQADETT
ncbi:MAG TPA: hypothetical protein IGQ44_10625 [Geminocystis sp. M7585_C2015_104]|nr:hypothetical protein [Geminocystis sp. M7585_C2015_104]